jgi:hypothetical protein
MPIPPEGLNVSQFAELLQQQGVKLQAGIMPTEMWGFIIFAIGKSSL